jgi:chemotaxis family two-component system sensor kinase Cph1
MTLPADDPDNCLTARLEFFDTIQPHGAMLVTNEDDDIVAASANCADWLGRPAEQLLGTHWETLFPAISPPSHLAELTALGLSGINLRTAHANNRHFVMARHRSGRFGITELEARADLTTELDTARVAVLAACTDELSRIDSQQSAAECLMRYIAMVTRFDRVMALQFMHDWHGKVVAEVIKPGVESYLHQHFPANDIPPNARALYTKKRQRLIADAASRPVPLISREPGPFDLTYAELRAVHPVHTEYMRNMGTASSFSVSIVVNGRLWGLVVCHNLKPRTVSFAERQLCELLANITALHLQNLQKMALANARHEHLITRTHLKQQFLEHGLTDATIQTQLDKLRLAFRADGAWTLSRGESFFSGILPSAPERAALLDWIYATRTESVFCSNQAPQSLRHYPGIVSHCSGVLFIQLTDVSFIVFTRNEQPENVAWAGKPRSAETDNATQELSPRTSFAVWQELTNGQALPWESDVIEAAVELRLLLRELLEYLSLEKQSQTDMLTGLGNRTLLNRCLKELVQTRTPDTRAAVLMIDLDNFKPVNDTLGHAAGDKLLVQAAQRIRAQLRDSDTVVRLGGDEFAIIIANVKDENDVPGLGQRLCDSLAEPFDLDGHFAQVSVSIGAALYPDHATDPDTLLHYADMAMYSVKHHGRNGCALFNPSSR